MPNGYRPLTQKHLDEEEHRIDNSRGRRYCPRHPAQQMIPILVNIDTCPICSTAPEPSAS